MPIPTIEWEGGLGGCHGEVHFGRAAHGDAGDDAAARGIEDVAQGFVGGIHPFASDVERAGLVFGRTHERVIAWIGTIDATSAYSVPLQQVVNTEKSPITA